MAGFGVDISQLPIWLVLILVVANMFKDQIGAIIPDSFRHWSSRRADREEHRQEIEETILNNRLQTEASEHLRKSWREEQWVELLQQMLGWMREDLTKELDCFHQGQNKHSEILAQLQRNTLRTNDILTTIHITLSKLADRRGDE